MSEGRWRSRLVELAVVGAAVLAGYFTFGPMNETLDQALAAGRVEVELAVEQNATSSVEEGTRIARIPLYHRHPGGSTSRTVDVEPEQTVLRVTLRRVGGLRRGKLEVTVPSGTRVDTTEQGAQPLATAYSVTLLLGDSDASAVAYVPAYCLVQHLPPPSLRASLSLAPAPPAVTAEEPSELQRLARCLEDASQGSRGKQQAIWLVAEGHLRRTREELRQLLRAKNRSLLEQINTAALLAEGGRQLAQRRPYASEGELAEELQLFMQRHGQELIDRKVAERTEQDLASLLGAGRDALRSCGYDLSATALGNG
jgi:hypothetical protein